MCLCPTTLGDRPNPAVPVPRSLAGSSINAIKDQISSFSESVPILVKRLNEVAKNHPFIASKQDCIPTSRHPTSISLSFLAVVLAFNTAITLELARREVDRKITALYVTMQDMVATLLLYANRGYSSFAVDFTRHSAYG